MPVRTGEQYLAGLRDRPREVHHRGQKVDDVTTFPGLANGARSIASLYDMQHDPKLRGDMTYTSPTSGDPVGLSFIAPRNLEDLQRRRIMMSHWAHTSYGMMGRTPDFLNVSIMAMA
ncbi:MAG: 4-hydroxyphenylacetate 3-hydroxylase N-terminal domain-containing protein, partial [Dehalococcoidia bacterium]